MKAGVDQWESKSCSMCATVNRRLEYVTVWNRGLVERRRRRRRRRVER